MSLKCSTSKQDDGPTSLMLFSKEGYRSLWPPRVCMVARHFLPELELIALL
jgi:hypothetical protein